MNTRNVTITSKNQVTLPAEYVKALHLTKSRVLRVEMHKDKLVLIPQPSLGDTMRRFWGKHNADHPLSDKEIKQGIRSSSVSRIVKG